MTSRQRPPLNPDETRLVRSLLAGRQYSRRHVLAGAGAGALGVGALTACGTEGGSSPGSGTASESGPAAAADKSDTEKVVNWANWTLYLDFDDASKTYPTLVEFEKQTGIKASYAEDIEDNDSYYAKNQGQWQNGQDTGKDIVVFTDWMMGRVIRQGFMQKLDKANIPNAANLVETLQNVDYDPGREYSLPWQSGFTGLAWNKEKVPGGLKNVADLWKPDLKGRVATLTEFRDTIGLIMRAQRVDPAKDFTADQFNAGIEEFSNQLSNGQIRQVTGNSYKELLISEDALAAIAWSGDITQINFENGDKWEFALPDSGGMLWTDNLSVPIGSPHKKNAETLLNYYYDPAVAATVAAYVNYICPVVGAREEMQKIDPDLAGDPLIFPDETFLGNVGVFRSLTADEETEYTSAFQAALGN